MKILIINGSPRGESSDTMKLTRAFLEGFGTDEADFEDRSIDVVDTLEAGIRPCLGCYRCWRDTPGICCQDDAMAGILGKIRDADLVVFSTPLYCYSVPSNLKALLDRLLPLSCPSMYVDGQGRTHHPAEERAKTRYVLISGCGFPEREGNYDALIFQFQRMFGLEIPMILCTEVPLLGIEEALPVAGPRIEAARRAGREYARDGRISDGTQAELDAPMLPPDYYRKRVNGD